MITSGGVSVGEADFVKQLLDQLGEVLFWKIAMKPGRPLAYGRLGDAHFFGLPGNPVSVMVTFYQFVREALLVLHGAARRARRCRPFKVPLRARRSRRPRGGPSSSAGSLTGRPCARLDGARHRRPGLRASCRRCREANCFIVLPAETGDVAAGEPVDVQLLEGLV